MSPFHEQIVTQSIKEVIDSAARKLDISRSHHLCPENLNRISSNQLAESHVICVASGKGGTGKTTVATNLAVLLANIGLKITLIDADFGLANSHLLLGIDPRNDISAIIDGNKQLDDIIEIGPANVKLVPGGSGYSEFFMMEKQHFTHLIKTLSSLEKDNDIIVIDLAAGINPQVMTLLSAAHDIILVSTPEVTSLIDAYALIKSLSEGRDSLTIQMIMNRALNKDHAVKAFQKIWSIVGKHLRNKVSLMFLGWLHQNHYVQNSIACRVPVVLKHPQCASSCSLYTIAHKLHKNHMFWKSRQIAPWGQSSYFTRLEKLIPQG